MNASSQDGETEDDEAWQEAERFIQSASNEMRERFDYKYPAALQFPNGRLHIVSILLNSDSVQMTIA